MPMADSNLKVSPVDGEAMVGCASGYEGIAPVVLGGV